MAERSILAYFRSRDDAEFVVSKLRGLELIDYSIDNFSRYPGDGVNRVMNPITSDFPSLGYLTLNADFPNTGAGILAAADVSASGMSDGGDTVITGRNILLTVVLDETSYEEALSIIESGGGMI